MQIYLARNNVQAGPYTLEQVNNMLASGEVLLEDLAWHEGMEEWKVLGELTHGQFFYDPNNSHPHKKKSIIMIPKAKNARINSRLTSYMVVHQCLIAKN